MKILLFILCSISFSQIYFTEFEKTDTSCSGQPVKYYTINSGCNANGFGSVYTNVSCSNVWKYESCNSCTQNAFSCQLFTGQIGFCDTSSGYPVKSSCSPPVYTTGFSLAYSVYQQFGCLGSPSYNYTQITSGCVRAGFIYTCTSNSVTVNEYLSNSGCIGTFTTKTFNMGTCQDIGFEYLQFSDCKLTQNTNVTTPNITLPTNVTRPSNVTKPTNASYYITLSLLLLIMGLI